MAFVWRACAPILLFLDLLPAEGRGDKAQWAAVTAGIVGRVLVAVAVQGPYGLGNMVARI